MGDAPLGAVTLIIPYYRNPAMLKKQMEQVSCYPVGFEVFVIDDGSPEPAAPIVTAGFTGDCNVHVYRIDVDIPWNRGGARNLGAQQAQTPWIMHVDIDHLLPAVCAQQMLPFKPQSGCAYRFERYRQGKADETRLKDYRLAKLPDSAEHGKVHPHVDSYLVERELYWKTGGYNEDFSGVLGGGSEFLRRLEKTAEMKIAPKYLWLDVYTRHAVPDASDTTLSRDRGPGKRMWKEKAAKKDLKPVNPVRFPWHKVY